MRKLKEKAAMKKALANANSKEAMKMIKSLKEKSSMYDMPMTDERRAMFTKAMSEPTAPKKENATDGMEAENSSKIKIKRF